MRIGFPHAGAERPLDGCARPRWTRPWPQGNRGREYGRRALYGLLRPGMAVTRGLVPMPGAGWESRDNLSAREEDAMPWSLCVNGALTHRIYSYAKTLPELA